MKKNVLFFLFPLAICLLFLSCNPENAGGGSGSKVAKRNWKRNDGTVGSGTVTIKDADSLFTSMDALKYFKANVDGETAAIGVSLVDSSSKSLGGGYLEKIIVKMQEENGIVVQVDYTVDETTDESGEQVSGFDGNYLQKGTVVQQSDLPGELDKLYVTGDYTFVSYLTVDTYGLLNYSGLTKITGNNGNDRYSGSLNGREHEDGQYRSQQNVLWEFSTGNDFIDLTYMKSIWDDKGYSDYYYEYETLTLRGASNDYQAMGEADGVSYYDTFDYCNTQCRESFIIDNRTGLMYSLEGWNIAFQKGVAIDSSHGPVTIETKSDGSLAIKEIVDNEAIFISHVFKDKYDQYYVLCDYKDEVKENNILYFNTIGKYIPTKEGVVLCLEFTNPVPEQDCRTAGISRISIIGEGFVQTELPADATYDIDYSAFYSSYRVDAPNSLRLFNEGNGHTGSKYSSLVKESNGSLFTFTSIKEGRLYGYKVDSSGTFYWMETDLASYLTTVHCCQESKNLFGMLPDRQLAVASKEKAEDKTYSLYALDVEKELSCLASKVFYLDATGKSLCITPTDALKVRYSVFLAEVESLEESQTACEYDFAVPSFSGYRLYAYQTGYSEESIRGMLNGESCVIEPEVEPVLSDVSLNLRYWNTTINPSITLFTVTGLHGSVDWQLVWDRGKDAYYPIKANEYSTVRETISLQPINR